MNLNERFTNIADRVSEYLGAWWFTIASLLILALWFVYGATVIAGQAPGWFTSNQFNFPLNTITTVGEWFIGALVAAAANRVERRNREQTAKMEDLEERIDTLVEGMAKLLEVDHVEHGRLLRDLHSHTVCTGHTVIASEEENPPPVRARRNKVEEKA